MVRKKVIIDVDTGMDDAIAILTAALSPALEILGITVTHGNLPLKYTLENTLRIVEFLGGGMPVYAGCAEPMVRNLLPGRADNVRRQTIRKTIGEEVVTIHRKELPLPEATIKPQQSHACTFIVDTLRRAKRKITLLAVGPLTNIGMALRMEPLIAESIEEIVVMGGGVASGNRTPVAEANFYDDPEAAEIVMRSGCKVRIITLDATESVLFDDEDIGIIRKTSQTGVLAALLLEDYIKACTILGIIKERRIAVHDAMAACAVIDPEVITVLKRQHCSVECCGGYADGQLIADRRGFIDYNGKVYVAYASDKKKCMDIIVDAFQRGK